MKKIDKPAPEAKALSLFLMAYKTVSPLYKEQCKRMNRQWDLVGLGKITKAEYMEEVQKMLVSYGGYDEVIEKTVRHYIKKTGKWKLQGDDKYCLDAKKVADKVLKK